MPRKKKEDVISEDENKIDSYDIKKLDGIGPIKAQRFSDAGVYTLMDVLVRGSQEITQITGMKKEEAEALIEKVRVKLIEDKKIPDTSNALSFDKYRKSARFFKTGTLVLDELLGGGVVTQAMTMIYGAEGAGKTQFSETVIVEALASNIGKPDNEKIGILFIDNEGTFDLDRVMQIAEVRGLVTEETKEEFMQKMFFELALDTDSIERVVNNCVSKIIENNIKLIVIDGMVGKYRLEFDQGRGELATRQNSIKPILKHLQNMSEYLDLAVLVTNQVMGNPDGGYGGEPDKPIGGHIVGHNFRYIIRFNKGGGKKRIAKFIKSNKHPVDEQVFYLNQEGVSDIENLKVGHCKTHDKDWVIKCRLCEKEEKLSEGTKEVNIIEEKYPEPENAL